jgi:hypothetical protein
MLLLFLGSKIVIILSTFQTDQVILRVLQDVEKFPTTPFLVPSV